MAGSTNPHPIQGPSSCAPPNHASELDISLENTFATNDGTGELVGLGAHMRSHSPGPTNPVGPLFNSEPRSRAAGARAVFGLDSRRFARRACRRGALRRRGQRTRRAGLGAVLGPDPALRSGERGESGGPGLQRRREGARWSTVLARPRQPGRDESRAFELHQVAVAAAHVRDALSSVGHMRPKPTWRPRPIAIGPATGGSKVTRTCNLGVSAR